MRSKWLIALLIASLTVNLLSIGYIAGREYKPRVEFDPTLAVPRWVRTLPEERRAEIRPIIREHFRNYRPHRRSMRDQHVALRTALTKEPYDREAVASILTAMRGQFDLARVASHESFLVFVDQLTAEERQQLAEDLSRPRKPRRAHTMGKDGLKPPPR